MTFRNIKTVFESSKSRTGEVPCDMPFFFDPNDDWSLPEIFEVLRINQNSALNVEMKLPDEKLSQGDAKRVDLEIKGNESKPATNAVDLVVGDSDIFSMDSSPDHIIICDINRRLLATKEAERTLLLDLYDQYLAKKLTYKQAKESYFSWKSKYFKDAQERFFHTRTDYLGRLHFLSSEEKYNKCMQALKKKEFAALDFNLFDSKEQDAFVAALEKADHVIRYINFTNLPDYDDNNALCELLVKLQQSKRFATDFSVFWNIHDTGPWRIEGMGFPLGADLDLYTHYPFAATSIEQYKEHRKIVPLLMADLDSKAIADYVKSNNLKASSISAKHCQRYRNNPTDQKIYWNRICSQVKKKLDIEKIFKNYSIKFMPRNINTYKFIENLNQYEIDINNLVQRLKKAWALVNKSNQFIDDALTKEIAKIMKYLKTFISTIRLDDLRDKHVRRELRIALDQSKRMGHLLHYVLLIVDILHKNLSKIDETRVANFKKVIYGILHLEYDSIKDQDNLRVTLQKVIHELRDALKPDAFNKLLMIVFSMPKLSHDCDLAFFNHPTLRATVDNSRAKDCLSSTQLRFL